MKLVERHTFDQGIRQTRPGLTNFTIWAGAGFSKSWDHRAPVGSDLFKLKSDAIEEFVDPIVFARVFGLDSSREISDSQFRQIVYQVDIYERYADVRPRYFDRENISTFKAVLKLAVLRRYQELLDLNYCDAGKLKFRVCEVTPTQDVIVDFFRFLLDQIDGSQSQVEGIRTHFLTTNYDFVIETILDSALGNDDWLYLYTYRGITPERIMRCANIKRFHQHWLSWNLLKINGGFEIYCNNSGYELDYTERSSEEIIKQPPVLMLPSREQDYSDWYFRAVFPKAVRLIRETRVLILVGYSLPEDVALLRFILRQFSEEPEDGQGKCISILGRSRTKKVQSNFKCVLRGG